MTEGPDPDDEDEDESEDEARAEVEAGGQDASGGSAAVDPPGDAALEYVAAADELDPGDRIVLEVRGREVAVFNVAGEFYALANYCPHQGGPACEGLVSGTLAVDADGELTYDRRGMVVSCPWHGWEFDIASGRHLAQTGLGLPTYEVVVRDGDLFVEL